MATRLTTKCGRQPKGCGLRSPDHRCSYLNVAPKDRVADVRTKICRKNAECLCSASACALVATNGLNLLGLMLNTVPRCWLLRKQGGQSQTFLQKWKRRASVFAVISRIGSSIVKGVGVANPILEGMNHVEIQVRLCTSEFQIRIVTLLIPSGQTNVTLVHNSLGADQRDALRKLSSESTLGS